MIAIKYTETKDYSLVAEDSLRTKYVNSNDLAVIFKCNSEEYPTTCTHIAVEIPTSYGIYNLFDCFDCDFEIESEERLKLEAKSISSNIILARRNKIPLSNLNTI